MGTQGIVSHLAFYHSRLTFGIDSSGWIQASSATWIERGKSKAKKYIPGVMRSFLHALRHTVCE